jgi:hypothetical protein
VATAPSRRRWLTLVIIGLAQLMVVLDATPTSDSPTAIASGS